MLPYILSKISTTRREKKLSQHYMATRLDISQSYYNKLENGKSEISANNLFKMLEVLAINPVKLFKAIQKDKETGRISIE